MDEIRYAIVHQRRVFQPFYLLCKWPALTKRGLFQLNLNKGGTQHDTRWRISGAPSAFLLVGRLLWLNGRGEDSTIKSCHSRGSSCNARSEERRVGKECRSRWS